MKALRILALIVTLAILQCAVMNPGSGSSTETAKVAGVLYHDDGTRAAGAKVACIPRRHNPYTGEHGGGDSTITDDTGAYKFETMAADTYDLVASKDTTMAFRDPVVVTNDNNTRVPPDTLRPAGSLRGVIRLEEGGDPRTCFVLFFGTRTFTWPDDSLGNFTSGLMAEGNYRVRILTTTPDYLPVDDTFDVMAGMDDVLPDTIVLPYTGIPVPKNLRIQYNTMKQMITLIWDIPTSGRPVQGYNIYRKHQDSDYIKINVALVSDSFFIDNSLRVSATYNYKVAVVDSQDSEGVKSDSATVDFNNRLILVTNSTPLGQRVEFSSVFFNGMIWVIGGSVGGYLKGDVWYSADGISWIQAIDTANFAPRRMHRSVVFDNKMWVIGGTKNSGSLNDVWYSTDGISWIQAIGSANFSPRLSHTTTIFDNKIWVIGGNGGSSQLNDVWYSSDGIAWIEATDSAQFSPRQGHSLLEFENKLWLMGGEDNNGYFNDVWYTQDGTTWLLATNSAGFSGRGSFSVAVLDSSMWVIGGYNVYDGGAYNDIWFSQDGSFWQPFNTPPTFGPMSRHATVVGNNRMWIVGATTSNCDVWYLQ